MADLVIQFLGGFTIVRQETSLTQFYSDKVRALLAYLVVESQQTHSRSKLAGLLWPEYDEASARQSLRQALAQLRKVLRDKENPHPFILADHQTIRWNPEAAYTLDVDAFEQAIETPNAALDAVALYQGDFLDGFFITDSADFEDWMLIWREQLRHDALAALEMVVSLHEHKGEFAEAQRLALRWRALDPLQEKVYQALMRYAIAQGDSAQALIIYEQCAEILSVELGVPPSAETIAFRDKARLNASSQPQPDETRQPSLPAPATPFIGRVQELAELDKQLFEPACRLLNLIGLGGIGKTRIALEVAQSQIVADAFAHGVYWVSLAGADALLSALITALGLEMPTGTTLSAHIGGYLAEREILLVLDNMEHLVHESSIIVELLAAAPRVKILCTSRVRIGVQAEWIWDVGGLSLPTSEQDIESSEAYQLFAQSAQRAQHGFSPQPDELGHIARVCQMVDGHPLSISLAAAWVRILSCREIRAEIASGLDFLSSEESDVAERHRSIQVIFDHTWQTLTPKEQEGLRDLSVFSGPFSRQAATEVAKASTHTLMQLVNRALVQRQDEFFTLHPVIRHYAADKLSQDQDADHRLRSAHSLYHLNFLHQQLGQQRGADHPKAQRYVRNLLDDIQKAWRWALAQRQSEAVTKVLNPLYTFYETSGWYRVGAELFQSAAESLPNEGSHEQNEGLTQLRNSLRTREAALRYRLGELTIAYEMLLGAYSSLSKSSRTDEVAHTHWWLGTVCHELGKYDEAKAHLQQAFRHYEKENHQQGIANVLREMADLLYFVEGEPEEAIPFYEKSLAAARRAKDRTAEILAILNHGCVRISLGQYDYAEELLQESLRKSRELEAKRLIGVTLNNLAIVVYADDPVQARKLTEENYSIRVEIDDRLGQANCLRHMAQSAGALGNYVEMLQLAEKAGQIYQEIGNERGVISGLSSRAHAKAHLGDLSVAQELLGRAIEKCIQLDSASAWAGAIVSGLELAVVQSNAALAFLLAGHIFNNDAFHSYDHESAEVALQKLRQQVPIKEPLQGETSLLARGAKAEMVQVQTWLENVAAPEKMQGEMLIR